MLSPTPSANLPPDDERDSSREEPHGRLAEAGVAITALAVAVASQWSSYFDPWVVGSDVNQHLAWMHRFEDPALFPDDILAEYAKSYQSLGILALYRALAPFVSAVALSKLLPPLLLALSAVFLFRVVRRSAGAVAGFLAALVFIVTPSVFDRMVGGTARSFAFPLLTAFLDALTRRSAAGIAITLLLQSLFYPVVFLLSAGTTVITLAWSERRRLLRSSQARAAGLAVLAGTGLLVAEQRLLTPPEIGAPVTRGEMAGRPEFTERGRYPILPTPRLAAAVTQMARQSLFRVDALTAAPPRGSSSAISLGVLGGFLAIFLVEAGRGRIRAPVEIASLAAASVFLFYLADALLFRLFLPERYLYYSVRVVAATASGVALERLLRTIPWPRERAVVAAALSLWILFHAAALEDLRLRDRSKSAGLYRFLASVPAHSVIAAHPYVADDVPLFARRKVYVDYEHAHPWFTPYWNTIRARTLAFFRAYFATDPGAIARFCAREHVDYLVVDRRHFDLRRLQENPIYFEPFDTLVRGEVRGRTDFALLRVDPAMRLYEEGTIFVLRCAEISR